jgi:hypothetical protein
MVFFTDGTRPQPAMNNGMVTFKSGSEIAAETFIEADFQPIFS